MPKTLPCSAARAEVSGGTRLRVQVSRCIDDVHEYLQPNGSWGSQPAWALEVTDTASTIAGPGRAGLGREQGVAGFTDFDNFKIRLTGAVDPNLIEITNPTLEEPYLLTEDGHTYRLMTNVTALDTAFIVTGKNVTLDLNGHTIVYNNRPAPKMETGEEFNGGFELPLNPANPTDTAPKHWDLSGAPGAERISTANRYGMFGDWMLRVTLDNTNPVQTIVSDLIELPASPSDPNLPLAREFAATVTPRSDSDRVVMRLSVLDDSGNPIEIVDSNNPFFKLSAGNELRRGDSRLAQFVPTTRLVRFKIELEKTGGTSEIIDLDYAELRASREFGVMASHSSEPVHLPTHAAVPNYKKVADFTLRDGIGTGLIEQGQGRAIEGHSIVLSGLDESGGAMLIDGVTTKVIGTNTSNIHAKWGRNITVRDSTFEADISNITRRASNYASLNFEATRGELEVTGNTVVGSPQMGIKISEHTDNTGTVRINHNTISQNAIVTNNYGIGINGVSNFEVIGNTIQPIYGRGILLDGAGVVNRSIMNGLISSNVVYARERLNREYPNLDPRSGETLEATALRIRNYKVTFDNLTFTGNTFIAETDQTFNGTDDLGVWAAIGMRLSLYNSYQGTTGQLDGTTFTFEDNLFRATVLTDDTDYYAFAATFTRSDHGPQVIFRNNNFEGNHRLLNFGDNDGSSESGVKVSQIDFFGNRYTRATGSGLSDRASGSFGLHHAFTPIYVGDFNLGVEAIRLVGQEFDASIPVESRELVFDSETALSRAKEEITVEWVVIVPVIDSIGNPIAGVNVVFTDQYNSTYSAVTGPDGMAEVHVVSASYSQSAGHHQPVNKVVGGDFTLELIQGVTTKQVPGIFQFSELAAEQVITLNPISFP